MNKRSEVKRTGVSRFLSISPLIGLLIGRGIKAAGLCLFMASFLASCGGLSVPTTWPEGRSTTSSQPVGPARKLPETSPRASKSTPKTTSNPPQTRAASPVTRDLYPYRSPSDARPAAPALPPSSQTLAAPPRERTVPQEQFAPPPVPQPPPAERAVPQREEPVTPSFTPLLNRSAPSVSTEPDQSPQMPPPPPMKTSSVRVALVLPLTGPNAKIGQAMLNAAQLALFSFSEKTFELLVHDTKGTPEGALDAVQLSIGDGARLILGPLLSASVKAIAPSARAANVPVVAFSSDRSVAGEGVFTLGFIPSAEVWRVVRYARKRGVQRFAALAPSTAYGETVLETFREAVERSGGSVVRVEMYEPHAQDYAPLIRDLADYETRRGALLAQRNSLKERDDELSRRALKRLEKLQTVGPVPFDALFLADGACRRLPRCCRFMILTRPKCACSALGNGMSLESAANRP